MKIAAHKVDQFIKFPDRGAIAVLLYGPDSGLVLQRAKELANWAVDDVNDPFNVVEISSDQLKGSPSVVNDEMAAISLMGGRRLVRFRNAVNGDAKAIEKIFDQEVTQEQAFLIVTAGDLKPGGLRKLFENTTSAAALPCYQDDIRGLTQVVGNKLHSAGFTFDSDVVPYMAINCQGDRMVVLSEIEKLSLYLGSQKHITLASVRSCVGETTESHFDDICNSLAMGNHNLVQQHLAKALSQGIMPVMILRATQRFFGRLHFILGEMDRGKNQESALKELRPPVFFKQLPLFKQFVDKLSRKGSKRMWNIVEELYNCELECKRTGANAELMCSRSLMKVASFCK
jgi:DNA polymerase-3 subunit delta